MRVIIPIGISGSGKSRLYKTTYSDCELLSPDEIRKELTGSISDQSKNNLVFKVADERLYSLLKAGKDIFYDATNLNRQYRIELVKRIKEIAPDAQVIYHILKCNPELSKERIKRDIENGVDRSVVPDHVIDKQAAMYWEFERSVFAEGAYKIFWESTRYDKV